MATDLTRTFVAGIDSGLFASAEYQQAFTGENWILNVGMSEDFYYGLMLTTAIFATIGTISCVVLSSIGNLSSAVAKMNSLQKHFGHWEMVKQIISKATGRKFKGGISKYTNYVNRWTGARLGVHEIIKDGIFVHGPHIHPWF